MLAGIRLARLDALPRPGRARHAPERAHDRRHRRGAVAFGKQAVKDLRRLRHGAGTAAAKALAMPAVSGAAARPARRPAGRQRLAPVAVAPPGPRCRRAATS